MNDDTYHYDEFIRQTRAEIRALKFRIREVHIQRKEDAKKERKRKHMDHLYSQVCALENEAAALGIR